MKVRTFCPDRPNIGSGVREQNRIHVNRDFPTALDLIDKLAGAGAEIHDDIGCSDIALEVMAA